MLTDLGLSYDFVASPQIEQGALDPRKVRVLVLPMSLAVSKARSGRDRGVSRAPGGIVIADVVPGRMDEHCAWAPAGMLRSLFPVAMPPDRELTPPADGRVASWRMGTGWSILLNRTFDDYPKRRASGDGGVEYRDLLRAEFERLGIVPAVGVRDAAGQSAPADRISRYRFGGADVVAVLQESLEVTARDGRDGVTVYDDPTREQVAGEEVVIRLPRVARVIDVRTGKDLGRTDAAKIVMTPGDAVVLALSDAPAVLTAEGPRDGAARRARVVRGGDRRERGRTSSAAMSSAPTAASCPNTRRTCCVEGDRGRFALATARQRRAGSLSHRAGRSDLGRGGERGPRPRMSRPGR